MPSQLLTLVTAVTSAAIALIGVWLANRSSKARLKLQLDHEADQLKAQIFRERGEELYVLVQQWLNNLAGYYLRRCSVMQGKLTYNQCLDLEIADGKENPLNFSRVELLINVYFPSTRAAYARTAHGRDMLNEVATEHKRAYERGDIDGTRFLEQFRNAIESIHEEGQVLQTQILERIRAA